MCWSFSTYEPSWSWPSSNQGLWWQEVKTERQRHQSWYYVTFCTVSVTALAWHRTLLILTCKSSILPLSVVLKGLWILFLDLIWMMRCMDCFITWICNIQLLLSSLCQPGKILPALIEVIDTSSTKDFARHPYEKSSSFNVWWANEIAS